MDHGCSTLLSIARTIYPGLIRPSVAELDTANGTVLTHPSRNPSMRPNTRRHSVSLLRAPLCGGDREQHRRDEGLDQKQRTGIGCARGTLAVHCYPIPAGRFRIGGTMVHRDGSKTESLPFNRTFLPAKGQHGRRQSHAPGGEQRSRGCSSKTIDRMGNQGRTVGVATHNDRIDM